jgi:hypothetical protein
LSPQPSSSENGTNGSKNNDEIDDTTGPFDYSIPPQPPTPAKRNGYYVVVGDCKDAVRERVVGDRQTRFC